MRPPPSASHGPARRGLAAVATALAVVGTLTLTAAPAGATEIAVQSTGRCAADGRFVVTWTVTNDMRDQAATLRKATAVPAGEGLALSSALPAGGRVTGTQAFRRGASGRVVLTVTAVWTSGVKRTSQGVYTVPAGPCPVTGLVRPPAPAGDAKPAATVQVTCEGIVTTLKNGGGAPATFTILANYGSGKPEELDQQVVKAGDTVKLDYGDASPVVKAANARRALTADYTVTLIVTATGMKPATAAYPAKVCAAAASASPSEAMEEFPAPASSPLAGDSLAVTGARLVALVGGAAFVLLLGFVMVLASRRRRRGSPPRQDPVESAFWNARG